MIIGLEEADKYIYFLFDNVAKWHPFFQDGGQTVHITAKGYSTFF